MAARRRGAGDEEPDAYSTLGLTADRSFEAVRAAYKTLAEFFHPDKGGDPYRWASIQRAHDTLCDPERRAEHDDAPPGWKKTQIFTLDREVVVKRRSHYA